MKPKKIWQVYPAVLAAIILSLLMLMVLAFLDLRVFAAAFAVTALVFSLVIWRFLRLRNDLRGYLADVSMQLNPQDRTALESTPMPVVLFAETGEIVWYNDRFRESILNDNDVYGGDIKTVFPDLPLARLSENDQWQITADEQSFLAFATKIASEQRISYVLYCTENTQLIRTQAEYKASRPVVLSLYLDNGAEITQSLRESERAQLTSQAEKILEDWISQNNGIFRKCGTDRFLAIIEYRYLNEQLKNKFSILDEIRTVKTAKGDSLTLSIGIGAGTTFMQAETASRQALDMALGRGGDQAALKTANGFDFYGGLSKSVERQTRVRSRVVASALCDLAMNAEQIVLMGHRYSDLDCLGSAVALAAAFRSLGKIAFVAYDPATTLAGELISRFSKHDLFVEKEEALRRMTPETLLIITDTHSASMLDIPDLYVQATSAVVIDHHRKMVDHIEDAVIFYHEPYSSSASEMVAELIQHIPSASVSKREAEALLAGIMLDTRNFIMKAGVRTFEAAAFLRKLGADTVEVKRLFSENISLYQRKAEIISTAEWYRNTAIAYGEGSGSEMRVASAQAADELLSVRGVDASFAMFSDNGGVHISARSYGALNVQLIMEMLGGGGHQTMAATFLKDLDIANAQVYLKKAIDSHLSDVSRSKS